MLPVFYRNLIFLMVLIFSMAAFSQENDKLRIATIDFSSTGGLSPQEARTLTNRLNSMLVKTNAFVVLERGKMDEILKEQGFQQLGCTTNECAVEVGKMLNVQKIINGFIGKIGSTYTIDITLLDIQTAQIERSFVQDYKGEIDGLLDIMESISVEIANITRVSEKKKEPEPKIFNLSIISNPDGARVFINDQEVGKAPFKSRVREGMQLEIRMIKKNYDEWYQKFTVTTDVDINANMKISKEYARELAEKQKSESATQVTADEGGSSLWWWVGGIAVAGGAAAAVLLSQSKDESPAPTTTADQGFPLPPTRPTQ